MDGLRQDVWLSKVIYVTCYLWRLYPVYACLIYIMCMAHVSSQSCHAWGHVCFAWWLLLRTTRFASKQSICSGGVHCLLQCQHTDSVFDFTCHVNESQIYPRVSCLFSLPVSQVTMGRSFLLMHTGVVRAACALSARVASYSSHVIGFNIYRRFKFSFRFFGRSISPLEKALNLTPMYK